MFESPCLRMNKGLKRRLYYVCWVHISLFLSHFCRFRIVFQNRNMSDRQNSKSPVPLPAKPIPPGLREGYKCVTCGKAFRSKDDITSHISKVHSTGSFKKVLMKADTRPKPSIPKKTIESIKIPRKTNSPVKVFRCNICRVCLKTRVLIEQHCVGKG